MHDVTTDSREATPGPLSGLRVLEFTQIAAGPYAGSLFADLGADVVKVERRDTGDDMRGWPPLMENGDGERHSANFASLNRGKRSFGADLKDEDDLAAVLELVGSADILIENFRPGVMNRLGLGYEAIRGVNPKIVYCSISGFGQTGPQAGRGAFDVTVQAASGLMSCTGEADGGPVKAGVPVGDFAAGLYAAFSALAALREGRGAHIDCSMLGSILGIAALQTSEYFGTGVPAGRLGSAHPRNAPYQAFTASDGDFVVAAGNDSLWRAVCEEVGRPELAEDPRFLTQPDRAGNQVELAGILNAEFVRRTRGEWLEALEGRGVPCSLIKDFSEVLADEQVEHLDLVQRVELGNGVELDAVAYPVKFTGRDLPPLGASPELAAHTAEVWADWVPAPR